jgi:multimeric flavodoxin WrbA
MKVIGIVGSPRKNGNTELLTAHALKSVSEEGITAELIRLAGLDIRPCRACFECYKGEQCGIKDDLFPIYLKMKEADGIILSSPVYASSISGLMKCFSERAGYISRQNKRPFEGKVGGPLIVGARSGMAFALAELNFFFTYQGMILPGSNYWNVALGVQKGDVLKDDRGMETAWIFGKNLARCLTKLRS